jgi:hypothetical protein
MIHNFFVSIYYKFNAGYERSKLTCLDWGFNHDHFYITRYEKEGSGNSFLNSLDRKFCNIFVQSIGEVPDLLYYS